MNRLLKQLFFSRLLGAVIIANFITTVIMNLFELKVYSTPVIYIFSVIIAFYFLRTLVFRRVSTPIDKFSVYLASALFILLSITRLVYVLDILPNNTVLVIGDDYARLAELISMTKSVSYPLQHPANPNFLLSFYYTGLYPFAVIKLLVPVFTLKNVIAFGNSFYYGLILFSLLEVSRIILRNVTAVRILIFFCTFFGGLDWLASSNLTDLWGHFEWWQMRLHGNTQISSFFTALFWTTHHVVGFYALVLAFVFLFYTFQNKKHVKQLAVFLLLASAFYSSPFSVMSVPLFLFIHRTVLWNKFCRSRVFLFIIAAMLVPLYIFLNKLPAQSFIASTFHIAFTGQFWLDKLLSLPIFLILIPLVEFAGMPFLLLTVWKNFSKIDKHYFIASFIFFLSTFFLAYSGANNYSMRGMLLPSFVLFMLFAKYIPPAFRSSTRIFQLSSRQLAGIVAVFLSIGTIKEVSDKVIVSVRNTRLYYQIIDKNPPDRLDINVNRTARDREHTTIILTPNQHLHPALKYNLEHFFDHLEIQEMAPWEKELLRLPREGMFY